MTRRQAAKHAKMQTEAYEGKCNVFPDGLMVIFPKAAKPAPTEPMFIFEVRNTIAGGEIRNLDYLQAVGAFLEIAGGNINRGCIKYMGDPDGGMHFSMCGWIDPRNESADFQAVARKEYAKWVTEKETENGYPTNKP